MEANASWLATDMIVSPFVSLYKIGLKDFRMTLKEMWNNNIISSSMFGTFNSFDSPIF